MDDAGAPNDRSGAEGDAPSAETVYREAWAAWQAQLGQLHAWRLDGEPLDPPRIKGLLLREARAFERYAAARRGLLGLGDPPA